MPRFVPFCLALAAVTGGPALAQQDVPRVPSTVEIPRGVPGAPIVVTPSQPAPGTLRTENGVPVYRVPESSRSTETGNYRAPNRDIPAGSTIILR
ncbi:hypothetical protein ACE7GA_12985 [Roseomonas sp. CCTCC AB2023176]|uniref:hypothetical protein n=1 Tax=Roseomonas sp. CCTCC AB2023176 TaxID=3342640 RepID=UPI0035E3857D